MSLSNALCVSIALALCPGFAQEAPTSVSLFRDKLTALDGAAGDNLGISVAVSGDTAVVGARFADTAGGSNAGAAYVFVRGANGWAQQAKLTAPDGGMDDNFGISVAISGGTVLVGAFFNDTPAGANAGAAYVFVRSGTTWNMQAKLTAHDAQPAGLFGRSVALQRNTALVGAIEDGVTHGSAYVFVRTGTTWGEEAKLAASDGANGDNFGISVALSEDTALVGSMVDDTPAGVDAGSAYVFVRSGTSWSQQAKLTAFDASQFDYFGVSVALSHRTAVVGAFFDDPLTLNSGSAYVFVRSGTTWVPQAKLVPSDGHFDDVFGVSVAVSGETAVIGATWGDGWSGVDEGCAYYFMRFGTVWRQTHKLVAPDAESGDNLGISVALSGHTALFGAQWDDNPAFNSGSAYVFWCP